ncbi:MAG: hypothetical protein QOJ08_2482 [Ilumatobacteraceae bacterium]|jgi:hypothetical protein
MLGQRHPFGKAIYEQDGFGHVRVTEGDRVGLFEANGTWIEGDVYAADPQMCNWIAGPKVKHHRLQMDVMG